MHLCVVFKVKGTPKTYSYQKRVVGAAGTWEKFHLAQAKTFSWSLADSWLFNALYKDQGVLQIKTNSFLPKLKPIWQGLLIRHPPTLKHL